MVLITERKQILQEDDLVVVDQHIIDAAANLAVLGEIDTARELISLFFSETQGLSGYYPVEYSGLNYAWQLTGNWPQHMPEKQKTDGWEDTASYNYNEKWKNLPADAKELTQDGLEAFMRLSMQEAGVKYMHERDYESAQLVYALKSSVAIDEGRAGGQSETLSDTSLGFLKRMAARLHSKKQIQYLTECPRIWPYLITGALAKAEGISATDLKQEADDLLTAARQRLFEGRQPPNDLPTKSLKELLGVGEYNSIHGPGKRERSEAGWKPPTTFFKDPATEAQIKELEARLDTTLPGDFKSFLSISNGFAADTNADHGIFNGYYHDPSLHSTDKISWIHEPWFELPVELLAVHQDIERLAWNGTNKNDSAGNMTWDTPLPLFTRILDIGNADVENVWLVHPDVVKEAKEAYHAMNGKGDERQKRLIERAMREFAGSRKEFEAVEWACVRWSAGGAANLQCYPSFRAYLEDLVESGSEDRCSSF